MAQLKEEYGVDFAAGTLSAAAKRGLKSNSLDMTLAVTPLMRIKSAVQRWRRKRTDPMPLCVTVCPASLERRGMHWAAPAERKCRIWRCCAMPRG